MDKTAHSGEQNFQVSFHFELSFNTLLAIWKPYSHSSKGMPWSQAFNRSVHTVITVVPKVFAHLPHECKPLKDRHTALL